MASKHFVIDVDSHYSEVIDELWEYMDEPWRTKFQATKLMTWIPGAPGDRYMEGRIRRLEGGTWNAGGYRTADIQAQAETEARDPKTIILDSMKELGVDVSILVANRLGLLALSSVRDIVVAACDAFIDYHLDKIADPAAGIYTMPVVGWHDPEAAAATIERVGDHQAVCGVVLMSAYANPPWGDPRYHEIYETAQRLGLPIVIHATTGGTLTEHGSFADGLQRVIEAHSLSFLISNQIHLTSMIMQGVPVRYPNIKLVFMESGLFWVPAMMYRLDEYFLKRRSEAPLLEDLPSEYIKRYCYFGTQPMEAPRDMGHLGAVFDMCEGRDHFMYASDYPHWDYDEPMAIKRLSFLSDQDKAKILGGNAMQVFRLNKGGDQPWQRTTSPASTKLVRASEKS
jgi:predicted TIM-barrel fold metal-dependent hydrolase